MSATVNTVKLQAAVDCDVDAAVCVLNPEADARTLAVAARARAELLKHIVDTLGCISLDVVLEPGRMAELLAPAVGDLEAICNRLVALLPVASAAEPTP